MHTNLADIDIVVFGRLYNPAARHRPWFNRFKCSQALTMTLVICY